MTKTYEVWDAPSANRLGTFRKLTTALAFVERVRTHGGPDIDDLGLLERSGEALTLLAEGAAILALAEGGRANTKVPAA